MDLLCADSIRDTVRKVRPTWILHPAAYTAVDKAESDREHCFAANAEATRILAEEAKAGGAGLVTFSTDYVFNGEGDRPFREQDAVAPLNVYGESKRMAEEYLASSGCAYVNLRTSWVYSARGHNFLKTILRLARERESLNVVDDQFGSPSSASDLADAVVAVMQTAQEDLRRFTGTYHLAGSGYTTWFGFARELVNCARELQPEHTWARLEPVASTAFPTPARRPRNSRLDTTQFLATFGFAMPQWQDSARKVVRELLMVN